MAELGGHPLTLRADELQLGRGESIADTARVLSRYLHAIVIRAESHETVVELAGGAEVPVVNGLTPFTTPARRSPTCSPCASARRPGRRSRSPTSATATTSPARWLSSDASPGSRSGSRLRRLRARARTGGTRHARSARGRGGGRRVYADVWVSMGDEETRAPPRRPRLPTSSTRSCSRSAPERRSPFTACRPTRARRSPRRSYTASARRSGTRPRTAFTRRRRCSSCCSAEPSSAGRYGLDAIAADRRASGVPQTSVSWIAS